MYCFIGSMLPITTINCYRATDNFFLVLLIGFSNFPILQILFVFFPPMRKTPFSNQGGSIIIFIFVDSFLSFEFLINSIHNLTGRYHFRKFCRTFFKVATVIKILPTFVYWCVGLTNFWSNFRGAQAYPDTQELLQPHHDYMNRLHDNI